MNSAASISTKAILVVEDQPIHLELVREQLAAHKDYTVAVASDRETAESHLASGHFDLVVLDSRIPWRLGDRADVEESVSVFNCSSQNLI